MPGLKDLIFKQGAKLIEATGTALDNLITNKEELAAAKLAIEQEANRHMEALQASALKELELENSDRDSARKREAEFVKATGHTDRMHTFVGITIMLTFVASFIMLFFVPLPEKSEHLMINAIGILEGLVISVGAYYFGSSAGSRLKDMRK